MQQKSGLCRAASVTAFVVKAHHGDTENTEDSPGARKRVEDDDDS